MTRMILALLATMAATPALAQHGGHSQPAPAPAVTPPAAPAASCTPEHAAMGHCTLAPRTPPTTPAAAPATSCTPEHAAMGHCTMSARQNASPSAPDPHAGHTMPTRQPASPNAATCAPEHAAMGHCTPSTTVEVPVAPPPPGALSGPAHAQDLFFDPAEAARSRAGLTREHGGMSAHKFLVDQLEVTVGDGREGYAWDAQFWYGGDIDKLWLKTEGRGGFEDELEGVELQALWSHAIDPWFDLQAGVRQDLNAGPDRTHLVLGVQGLAPYWFEVDGSVYLSSKGEVTARLEVEYDLRLTQRLILQPVVEVDLSLQEVPELGLGAGLATSAIGARLRYEFFPDGGLAVIAPYVGVEYEQAWGGTRDIRVAAGEDAGGVRFVGGIRLWF